MVRIVGGLFHLLKLVDFPIKLGEIRRVQRAQNEVADIAILLPFALDIDFRPVGHRLLR